MGCSGGNGVQKETADARGPFSGKTVADPVWRWSELVRKEMDCSAQGSSRTWMITLNERAL